MIRQERVQVIESVQPHAPALHYRDQTIAGPSPERSLADAEDARGIPRSQSQRGLSAGVRSHAISFRDQRQLPFPGAAAWPKSEGSCRSTLRKGMGISGVSGRIRVTVNFGRDGCEGAGRAEGRSYASSPRCMRSLIDARGIRTVRPIRTRGRRPIASCRWTCRGETFSISAACFVLSRRGRG